MKIRILLTAGLAAIAMLLTACGDPEVVDVAATPTSTPGPAATATLQPTPSPSPVPTSVPARSPVPSYTPIAEAAWPDPNQLTSGLGLLVGVSRDHYAIANHPQHHMFFHNGWWIFYKDETAHIQAVYMPDNASITYRVIASHVPISRGFSVIYEQNALYLVYTDSNDMNLYLRKGSFETDTLELAPPVTVVETGKSFATQYPGVAVDQTGTPWIVYRSYHTGEVFKIWITTPKEKSLATWHDPTLVSSEFEDAHSGFSTSSAVVVFDDKLVVISSGNVDDPDSRFLFQYESDSIFPPIWTRSIITDKFGGIHDYVVTASGNKLHLTYVEVAESGLRMVYRTRSHVQEWANAMDMGPTVRHSTASSIDSKGRSWIFSIPPRNTGSHVLAEGEHERIYVHVIDPSTGEVTQPLCIVSIPPQHQVGRPVLAYTVPWVTASPISPNRVGVVWMEGIGDQYQVMFRSIEYIPGVTTPKTPNYGDCIQ